MKKRVKKRVSKKSSKKVQKKITKKRYERISSGIKNFDNLIEGGFIKDSTNLLVGGPGSGKTILAIQFLLEGLKRNEPCLYVTFEETKEPFYKNMKMFGWDLEKYEKSGKFTFLNYSPIKVKTMLEEGGGTIENIIIKNKIKRMVIDSITSFTLLFDDELKKREASLELFNIIKKWDCTTLLTFEGTPVDEEKKMGRALEFESDSIIFMHFVRKVFKRERFIEVLKMRGTDHSKNMYAFKIEKNGLNIINKPVKNIINL